MSAASSIGARPCRSGKRPKVGWHQTPYVIVPPCFFASILAVTVPRERCD